MNRVFSGYYPNNVCGVVYQNARRHLACQFTFACDGTREVVNEPDMWEQAKDIAKDTLDGKIWLGEVGHATHYHAYWVHPSWFHQMKKMYKLGVHTFYRPRAWGDGSDAPIWGATPNTGKADAPRDGPTLTKAPQAAVTPPHSRPAGACSPRGCDRPGVGAGQPCAQFLSGEVLFGRSTLTPYGARCCECRSPERDDHPVPARERGSRGRKPATWRTPVVIIGFGCLITAIAFGPRATLGFFLTPLSTANHWGRDVFAFALAVQICCGAWGSRSPA